MSHVADLGGRTKKIVVVLAATATLSWVAAPAEAGVPGTARSAPAAASRAKAAEPTQHWSPWTPFPQPTEPQVLSGLCTEDVTATFPVNKEEQRSRLIPGGNVEQEVRGPLVVSLTPRSRPDEAYVFDISGASRGKHSVIYYANGDVLFRGVGPGITFFDGASAQGTGLPRFTYFRRGGISNLFDPDNDKAAVIERPRGIVDLCAYLGLDSVPVPPLTS